MPLRDKFWLWPYPTDSLVQASTDMLGALSQTALKEYCVAAPNKVLLPGALHEFLALVCRNYNVNPWWLLISFQREQSGFGVNKASLSIPAALGWLGAVGKDIGRTNRPGYYGVYMQVERVVEQTSWLMGLRPVLSWPEYHRTGKESARFRPGVKVPLFDTDDVVAKVGNPGAGMLKKEKVMENKQLVDRWMYYPSCFSEHVQLVYTPHLEVLNTNESVMKSLVPPAYW